MPDELTAQSEAIRKLYRGEAVSLPSSLPEVSVRLSRKTGARRVRHRARVIARNLRADGYEIHHTAVGRKRSLVRKGVLEAGSIEARAGAIVALIDASRSSQTDPPAGVREPRRQRPSGPSTSASVEMT